MTRLVRDTFQKYGDDLAPGFDLAISGIEANKATSLYGAVRPLISEVVFEDDENLSSVIEMTLINQPETGPGKPVDWNAVIDSKAFQEGNFIDLRMGYGNSRYFMDRGEIVKWMPQFPSDGPATVTIKAYDGRHRMMNSNKVRSKDKKKKTYYKNMPDEEIVKTIAMKYGYEFEVDPTEVIKKRVVTSLKGGKKSVTFVIPTRVQESNKSDWDFLYRLAQINNFDLWVDYSKVSGRAAFTIYFKKKETAVTPGYLFTYNGEDGSLISAAPDFAVQDQATSVEVFHFDKKERKIERVIIEEMGKAENVKLGGARIGPQQLTAKKSIDRGARVRFSAFGQTITAIANRPFRSKKDALRFIDSYLKNKERELVVLRGKVVGVPDLRSRQVHQIKGLSNRIDGFYRFTNTRHTMRPGEIYTVEFTGYKLLSQDIARRVLNTNPRGIDINETNRGWRWGSKDPLKLG